MGYNQKLREEWIQTLVTSIQQTNIVYLIGTASGGPVNHPINIRSEAQLLQRFGTEGSLIEAYQSIQPLLDSQTLYLVKSSGVHAELSLDVNQENVELNAFKFVSKQANEVANHIQIELSPCFLHIIHPAELGGHRMSYDLRQYGVMGDLVRAINTHADKGQVEVYASCEYEEWLLDYPFYACNPTRSNLTGGASQCRPSKDEWYESLQKTYDVLEGLDIHVIVPINAYLDDVRSFFSRYGLAHYGASHYHRSRDYLTLPGASFHTQLHAFCQKQLANGCSTHGVMGLNPQTFEDERSHLAFLTGLAHRYQDQEVEDASYGLISVVATDVYYDYYRTIHNGYLAYAMLLTKLSPSQNPTNQPLGGAIQLVYEVSEEYESAVSEQGFVSFRYSPYKQGTVVKVDTSFTQRESGLRYYHNVRMCQLTCLAVKELVDAYIGTIIEEVERYHYLESELTLLLNLLVSQSILSEYTLDISTSVTLGSVEIAIAIKTKYMVESVVISGDLAHQMI